MTAEAPTEPQPAPEADITRLDLFDMGRDDVLAELVDMMNCGESDDSAGIGVTLFTNGLVVSGMIVSGARFFDKYAEFFAEGQEDEQTRAKVKDHFGSRGKLYGPRESREGGPDQLPHYIHLENARAFSSSGKPIPANQGLLWRGKLSSIDGFSLGLLQAQEP